MTVMDEYRAGRAGVHELAAGLEYWRAHIDRHPDAPGVEDWLGMTWAEFTAWYLDGRAPRRGYHAPFAEFWLSWPPGDSNPEHAA